MNDVNPQQEPSMEEILASIRRIISDDDKPDTGSRVPEEVSEGKFSATEVSAEEVSDDVLELTEVAEDVEDETVEGGAPSDEIVWESSEESADEKILADDVPDKVAEKDGHEPLEREDDPVTKIAEPIVASVDTELLAAETAAAAAGTLSALISAVDRAHGGSVLGDGSRTIEDLVKEVMKPMVKEWLDENLPSITERLVRREIERLARAAEDE
ncbi:DUF2497 domain-containing protein [Alphaproteobacteria bacterium]|nr:DUF2497 domain-containing protein [Alphaproteobacteria bacterium]